MPTFARIDASGYAIDVYDAPDALTLVKRMGVSGFVEVPDGTKNHAVVTMSGSKVMSAVNPAPPVQPEAPEPPPTPLVNDRAISFLNAMAVELVPSGIASMDELKVILAALDNASKGTP